VEQQRIDNEIEKAKSITEDRNRRQAESEPPHYLMLEIGSHNKRDQGTTTSKKIRDSRERHNPTQRTAEQVQIKLKELKR
jgi:hypothetical protein